MKNNSHDFKAVAEVVSKKLATYLDESQQGNLKALVQQPAEQLAKELQLEKWVKNGGINSANTGEFLDTYLANTQHIHHPHYIGHQVAVPHVASGIADFIHGTINNPMAIYEMGPAAAVIEKFLINWMLEKIGWFKGTILEDFSRIENNGAGILTHGGSLANLTALSAARAKIAPDSWTKGTPNDLVVLVKAQGKRVLAVVANACTTATGLYDPLDAIGSFCQEHNLWYHIDGAHGASALLSDKEKQLLKGIEKADSIIWDAHKMMRTSSLCAAVLFKNHEIMERAFQQKGSYLFHDKEEVGFDLMPYAVECTKSALGTKLFWVLAAEGEKGIANYIEKTYQNTRLFYNLFNKHPDFECPYIPESNILCFQYTKFGIDNDFQLQIRNKIVNRGHFYITSTEFNNVRYLRITVMNDLTKTQHIYSLIDEIVEVARHLNQSN